MNSFVNALNGANAYTRTENGAVALNSTGDALVDLFGVIGALRSRSEQDIERLFALAFAEDQLLATKMAFYARNVRGGLGERRTTRVLWRQLAVNAPEIMIKNLAFVPLFGRWDDLYIFVGTPVEDAMWQFVKETLNQDTQNCRAGKSISLAAKWLHSPTTSSSEARRLGRLTARRLKLSETQYRKGLHELRKHLNVVEVKMTNNEWAWIDYPHVPSRAMLIYRKAFQRHDPEGFASFVEGVSKGEQKVNASALFPYDIMEKMGVRAGNGNLEVQRPDALLEAQWKALPEFVTGENNILVMSDTSQSMNGRPLLTAVGLAVYFAERNKGAFKDMFMTFSSRPTIQKIVGNTLAEKIESIKTIVQNTNLELAFECVLQMAVENNVPAEDMPKSIVVISDMEIDKAKRSDSEYETFYVAMKRRFAEKGYVIPNLVFWNVDSRKDTFHARSNVPGVQLASGQSVSVFKSVIANIGRTSYEGMLATLNDPMYDCITL